MTTHTAAIRDALSSEVIVLTLTEQIELLRSTPAYRGSDHSATTLAKHPGMRLVLVALKAEGEMQQHHADAVISVHCLEGELRFTTAGTTHTLKPGSVLLLGEGLPHSVRAVQPSAFLLTMGGRTEVGADTGQLKPVPGRAVEPHVRW